MGGWDYRRAGVDSKAGDELVDSLKKEVATTYSPEVLTDIGGFGGLFQLQGYERPVLVASTDGVGTKLLIAQEIKRHRTIGQDLVAMSVNDILVQGARPLFFLDYLATGRLDKREAREVIQGIIEACKIASCALLGGETAEMPDFYPQGRYDLAGFALGVVEREKMVTGEGIEPGDLLVGLSSNGLHSNGFSLVRKVLLEEGGLSLLESQAGLGSTLGEELLRPTHIYVSELLPLLEKGLLKGMAHITGGGIPGNLLRILPDSCQAIVETKRWSPSPIFKLIQKMGKISKNEMFSTFNMGVGFILVIKPDHGQEVLEHLLASQLESFTLGEVRSGERGVSIR